MIRTTGQWLRVIGLLIEMIGLVAIVRERGGTPAPSLTLPGGRVISSAWIAADLLRHLVDRENHARGNQAASRGQSAINRSGRFEEQT